MAHIDFNDPGIKGFFARHVEKIVFGVCVAMVAVFFCLGYGIETISGDKTPAELWKQVYRGQVHIHTESWDVIGPTRTVEPTHLEQVVEGRKPVEGQHYSTDQYWLWPTQKFEDRRLDPELYRPEQVVADGFYAQLPFRLRKGQSDPLKSLPYARDDADDMAEPDDDGGDDDPDGEDVDPDDPDADPLGGVELDVDGGDPGVDVGFDRAAGRRLSSSQRKDLFEKYHYYRSPPNDAYARSWRFVAIRAVVPYKKQLTAYDAALRGAMGFDEERDQPQYFYVVVQRAEDTGKPIEESDWKTVTNTKLEKQWAEYWPVRAPELVDPVHLHSELSSPAAPGIWVDGAKLATHPAVQWKTLNELRKKVEKTAEVDDSGQPPGAIDDGILDRPGGGPKASPDSGDDVDGGDIDDVGVDDDLDGDESDVDGLDGDGADDGDDGDAKEPREVADWLLVRAYDLQSKDLIPGHSYRYRVKVFLQDPNNPEIESRAAAADGDDTSFEFRPQSNKVRLDDSMLDQTVIDRLAEIRKVPEDERIHYRATEWSDASLPVRIPEVPQRFFAGSVVPPQITFPNRDHVRVKRKSGFAKLLTVVLDDNLAVDIAGEIQAARGAVLNFASDPVVLHPLTLELRELTGWVFETDAILVDFRGGENLGTSRNPLSLPGEMLLVDRHGNMIVRDEVQDARDYRGYLFQEDEKPANAPDDTPGGSGGNPLDDVDLTAP